MMKKFTALVTAALMILGGAFLSAQDDVAVKKVIPGAMEALANFQFDKAWSAWCDDGFVVRDGVKSTLPELKKSGKYMKLQEIGAMKKAKNLEELSELMVKSGDMSRKEKETLLASPEESELSCDASVRPDAGNDGIYGDPRDEQYAVQKYHD